MSDVFEQLRWWLLAPVIHRLDHLEFLMAVTQADLDQIASGLVDTEGLLQQAIADLEAANPNLDLTGIRDAAASLAALVPSNTGGGEGPIAPDPGTPVVPDPGAGDGGGGVSVDPNV